MTINYCNAITLFIIIIFRLQHAVNLVVRILSPLDPQALCAWEVPIQLQGLWLITLINDCNITFLIHGNA